MCSSSSCQCRVNLCERGAVFHFISCKQNFLFEMKLFIISVCAAVALIQEATAWKCFGCFRPPKTAETHQYQQPEITDVGKNFIAKYTCKLPDAFDQTTIREDPQMLQISDFLMPGKDGSHNHDICTNLLFSHLSRRS